MLDAQTYSLFLATAVVLVLSPGPDTILILSRTLASGTPAGLMTLIGTQVGNVVHALLAGVGVSTILLVFPVAFNALKIVGVAYLIYLAVKTWRAPVVLDLDPTLARHEDTHGRFFWQGLFNNLANPKMVAFFIALFPQFIRPEHGSLAAQSLILGTTLAGMAIVWIGVMVVMVGRARTVVARSTMVLRLANRLAAATFFGLACRLAIQKRR